MGAKASSTSLELARRLVVTKQRLAGKLPARSGTESILSVIRDLCYVQLDPISVVAPSHLIALWSRLGTFRLSDLDRLLWDEKKLFEHWSHAASIVLTEDYPIHSAKMRRYPESLSKSWGGWRERARTFLASHAELRTTILKELRKGPLRLSEFEDHARTKKSFDGWSSGSKVSTMLFHLQMRGEVMVVGHQGTQKVWGLSETFLPSWVERKELPEAEAEGLAVERSIRALGIASPSEINVYFLRGQYHDLRTTLERLEDEAVIHRVHVEGLGGKDVRYVHDQDLPLLESMDTGAWRPRMSLLSPFDNLLALRGRVENLFGFHYATEIYVPEKKRKFGYYVLPILWGDRFLGRIDPQMDRKNGKLVIHSIHAERGAPSDGEVSSKLRETIEHLAGFLGAKDVVLPDRLPTAWRKSLR